MGGRTSRRPEKLIDDGLKICHAFIAGRVGWRGVDKIRLAGIGSARRRKEVGLQSEVRYPTTGTPHRSSPRLEGSPAIPAGLFLFEHSRPPGDHPLFPVQPLSTSWALPMGGPLPCLRAYPKQKQRSDQTFQPLPAQEVEQLLRRERQRGRDAGPRCDHRKGGGILSVTGGPDAVHRILTMISLRRNGGIVHGGLY